MAAYKSALITLALCAGASAFSMAGSRAVVQQRSQCVGRAATFMQVTPHTAARCFTMSRADVPTSLMPLLCRHHQSRRMLRVLC